MHLEDKIDMIFQKRVTDIVVEGVLSEVLDGDSFQVNASVLPTDAFFKGVEFATSDRDIFTVSKDGLVTAINPGTATLTITDFMGYVVKTYEITVYAVDSVDVSFSEGYTGILEPGQTVQLTPKAFGKNAANATFKYSVADELIAKVDENGLVTAVASGVTALIIKDETGTLDTLEIMIKVESLSNETAVDEILNILAQNNYALVDAGNVCLYNDGKNKESTGKAEKGCKGVGHGKAVRICFHKLLCSDVQEVYEKNTASFCKTPR
jgi:hypothetical protein